MQATLWTVNCRTEPVRTRMVRSDILQHCSTAECWLIIVLSDEDSLKATWHSTTPAVKPLSHDRLYYFLPIWDDKALILTTLPQYLCLSPALSVHQSPPARPQEEDVHQQRPRQDRWEAGGEPARGPQHDWGRPRLLGREAEGDVWQSVPQLLQLLPALLQPQHRPLHDRQDEAGQGEAAAVPAGAGGHRSAGQAVEGPH